MLSMGTNKKAFVARCGIPLLVLLLMQELLAQAFQDFLDQVNAAPADQREAIVDSFLSAVAKFPLIERDTVAHFVYRGPANNLNLGGDHNDWNPMTFPMEKLSTTNLWYQTLILESDARIFYKFARNGGAWILDARNPVIINDWGAVYSELAMPDYAPPLEVEFIPNLPHGTLQDTSFFSTNLNNSRTIKIYTPPFYQTSNEHYPVILFEDGLNYLNEGRAQNIIDYLIFKNRIRPLIAVFVPPVLRSLEYADDLREEYMAFVVEEVMPWVDTRFRTLTDPAHRAVMGASYGGNISLWIGVNHPEVFGNIGAQSSRVRSYVLDEFRSRPKLELKIHFDMGTYDFDFMIAEVDSLASFLASQGYVYQLLRVKEGHNWRNWRARVDDALEFFFPKEGNSVENRDSVSPKFTLRQNYPNPFNPVTTLGYSLPQAQRVSLKVYDLAGREIAVLVNGLQTAGEYSLMFDGGNLPSGVFFYKLTTGAFTAIKKMVLIR